MQETDFEPSSHSRVRTHADRASYDRATIYSILDTAPYCHVGIVSDGRPVVIPMFHAREGNRLYLHGSPNSRLLREMVALPLVCLEATILDGLLVGRSVTSLGFNYRSAVVFGRARAVEGHREKLAALRCLSEKAAPGCWDQSPPLSDQEVAATAVVAVEIIEASAKIRSGGPAPSGEGSPGAWIGVIPFRLTPGEPVPDPSLPPGIEPPAAWQRYLTS